jgi:hypothetical protein
LLITIDRMSHNKKNDKNDKNEKRGLASANEETRQRVASEGGKASHKNDNKGKKK